ncbi:MAG: hypothetical protein IJQ83_02800 [Bacteroidales bacterium]|nr:hypothetical protein [Bacteroidales bacterium]
MCAQRLSQRPSQAELFKQRDWLIAQDLPDKRLSDPPSRRLGAERVRKDQGLLQWLNRTVKGRLKSA